MDRPIDESRRLQERYASLTDDELQAVASDSYDLTDIAKQMLQSEIMHRGVDIRLQPAPAPAVTYEPPEGFDANSLDLIVGYRVGDAEEARKVMGVLHDVGLPCYLGPDNVEDADAFHSSFDGGVDLKVRAVDQPRARSVILHAFASEPGAEEEQEYMARCPKCHSTEIVFQGLDGNPGEESLATEKFNWTCDNCGYQWKDDGVEQAT